MDARVKPAHDGEKVVQASNAECPARQSV